MRCSAHLLLSGHRAERQKTIPCLLLTQGERMRKLSLYESGERGESAADPGTG